MKSTTDRNDAAVNERYSEAAATRVESLCCAVEYDDRYLAVLPDEILSRDYGCGDPSRHLAPGEDVLDLGSGAGKVCFIASQVVGSAGSVIGVDFNDDMLRLAETHRAAIGERIGYHNVQFRKGRIQDLALDHRAFEQHLGSHPAESDDLEALERWKHVQRTERPMIASRSIDVVISNCVLNLVRPEDREQLFRGIYRVLRDGGRAVISDIVCNAEVPEHLHADPDLWSGCISGAFREDRFVQAFERAGFEQIRILERDASPWKVVAGIEFRSVTVQAFRAPGDSHRQPCC